MVSSLILLRSLRVYTLKPLFFSISVNSGFGNIYLTAFAAWQIFSYYSPRFQRIIVKYLPKEHCWPKTFSFPQMILLASLIDLVTVFDAILTSRQTREKLQCLYENLMSNNFRRTAVLKKISIVN